MSDKSLETLFQKMEKFKSKSLDISELIPNEEGLVYQIAPDFKWSNYIPFEKAKILVLKGYAQVHSPNTIYMLQNKDGTNRIIRQLVLERDKNKCYYCGKYGNTVDHIIPLSKGGKTSLENLVCACEKCNDLKKDELISKKEMKNIILDDMISKSLKSRNKWD